MVNGSSKNKLEINVCVGTGCFVKGSQDLLHNLIGYIEENKIQDRVDVKATFCMEHCDKGPSVKIGDQKIIGCTLEDACSIINEKINVLVSE